MPAQSNTVCPECGTPLVIPRPNRPPRFCSRPCAMRYRHRNSPKAAPPPTTQTGENPVLCACGCGTPTLLRWPSGPPRRFAHGHQNRGVHNPRYKGEQHPPTGINGQYVPTHTYTDKHGYVHCYVPIHPHASNGYVSLHRLTMEQALGRYLELGEVVHHRPDAPKDTADPAQLELFASNGEHRRIAHGANGRWSRLYEACVGCGTTATSCAAAGLCQNCYKRQYRARCRAMRADSRLTHATRPQ